MFWAEVSPRALEAAGAEGLPQGRPADQPGDPPSAPGKGKLGWVITIAATLSPQRPSLRAPAGSWKARPCFLHPEC